jgi:hypothetical protein
MGGMGNNSAASNGRRLPAHKAKGRTAVQDPSEHSAQNIVVGNSAMAAF